MAKVVSDLLTAAYSKSSSVLLSMDISAAVDTFYHLCLLQHTKELFGFDDLELDWLQSYLAGREILSQWMVSDHQPLSSPLVCLSDQSLGRSCLLFSLHQWGSSFYGYGISLVCWWHSAVHRHQVTQSFEPDRDLCLCGCCEWLVPRNDLLLNPTKTEALITGIRQQVEKLDQSSGLPVFGVDVPFISKLWLLVVMLDCHLLFGHHITSIVRVCNCQFTFFWPLPQAASGNN